MESIKSIIQKPITIRIITLSVVALLIYLMRDMLNLCLLTFLFAYLMYSAQKFLSSLIHKLVRVKIERVILTLLLYVIVITFMVFAIYRYLPLAFQQIMDIFSDIAAMINQTDKVYDNPVMSFIMTQLHDMDISAYIEGKTGYIFQLVGDIGQWGLNLFLAIILSLFFILEKDRVARFVSGFETSKIAPLYRELKFYCNRLLNSFGKVIQAQILIALCNSVLSVIGLKFLGFGQLMGLGVMIFVLSLIPVAGVVISFVPLSIIAYQIGGYMQIIYVVILILILHAIEAYLLNPKLMSMKTELPVFMTFLLLIFSEHFIGIWGLIIGIPIFIFILDLLEFNIKEKRDRITLSFGKGKKDKQQAEADENQLVNSENTDTDNADTDNADTENTDIEITENGDVKE